MLLHKEAFANYLRCQNYSDSTIYNYPRYLNEALEGINTKVSHENVDDGSIKEILEKLKVAGKDWSNAKSGLQRYKDFIINRKPVISQEYTHDEVVMFLAGGHQYARTKNREVVGFSINPKYNPKAPDFLIVGNKKGVKEVTDKVEKLTQFVPLFIKNGVDKWEFHGYFKPSKVDRSNKAITSLNCGRPIDEIDCIIFLEKQSEPETQNNVDSNSGFPVSAEHRKKVEEKSVRCVVEHFENLGYISVDRQKDNCGYDYKFLKKDEVLNVEIKGTSLLEERFFLSKNEHSYAFDEENKTTWRMAIVSNVLFKPKINFYDIKAFKKVFDLEPCNYQGKQKI